MYQRVCLLLTAVTLSLLGFHGHAAADDGDHSRNGMRLYGGLGLGFGGKAKVDASGPFGLIEASGSDDMTTSIGGQVGLEYGFLRFLSLGVEARLLAFNIDSLDRRNVDRSKLLDIVAKPKLRLPLGGAPIELYFTVPVGLTVPFLADDFGDGVQDDAKAGWTLGVGGGANFWLTDAFALNAEPMFLVHKFRVSGNNGGDADITLKQFTLFLNAVVAL